MTRRLLYMAHPVSPTPDEIAAPAIQFAAKTRITTPHSRDERAMHLATSANINSAMRWLAWLRKSFPETTFIAPWIAGVLSVGGDGSPEEREAGMVDCCAVVERCDGIVLVGGRISSGMRREMEHGQRRPMTREDPNYFEVYDLTGVTARFDEPGPGPGEEAMEFHRWAFSMGLWRR